MSVSLTAIDDYLKANKDAFESQLCELLRIPSVSADSEFAGDVRRAAYWMADHFEQLGFATQMDETPGFPVVYAESPKVDNAPTALVYGHYDVQPPDPLDEWITPAFEPTERDGNLYARGATDDKGQMFTHVKSAEAWMKTTGSMPINLKYVIEGEEEVGSENLEAYIAANREKLACDCVVISDTCQFAPGQPAITYGLRGIAYYELRLSGPKQDLHSGTFGGGVTNPANSLTRMLAALSDEDYKVQVPGFYDDVVALTSRDRESLQALSFNDQRFFDQVGVKEAVGESGFSVLERRWSRPSFDVNGIWGGYQGEGEKTVLPARAAAKFSFRLVPDQQPEKITEALRAFLEELCPPGISMELIASHASPGVVVPLDSPYVKAASQAIESGFGNSPVYIREGGSIPVVTQFAEQLGADTLLLGWGQSDDNTHSPNEKFSIADFHRGIRSSAYLWAELAKIESN